MISRIPMLPFEENKSSRTDQNIVSVTQGFQPSNIFALNLKGIVKEPLGIDAFRVAFNKKSSSSPCYDRMLGRDLFIGKENLDLL